MTSLRKLVVIAARVGQGSSHCAADNLNDDGLIRHFEYILIAYVSKLNKQATKQNKPSRKQDKHASKQNKRSESKARKKGGTKMGLTLTEGSLALLASQITVRRMSFL